MHVLDLFSGIGGFSLGLERAGMQTVAFCEINSYCRRVLREHWPNVPIYRDVSKLTGERLHSDGIVADLICGGFPCQDISVAGDGRGISGARSRLWSEFARIIGEVRPRFAIVENVSALLDRGLGDLLGDLASLGYDAEWHCLPASAIGAPHRRDRVWIIAYPEIKHKRTRPQASDETDFGRWDGFGDSARQAEHVPDAGEPRLSVSEQALALGARWYEARRAIAECDWWSAEPDVGRVAHGVSARVDKLKSLGNAVVPQLVEVLGRAIMECDGTSSSQKVASK